MVCTWFVYPKQHFELGNWGGSSSFFVGSNRGTPPFRPVISWFISPSNYIVISTINQFVKLELWVHPNWTLSFRGKRGLTNCTIPCGSTVVPRGAGAGCAGGCGGAEHLDGRLLPHRKSATSHAAPGRHGADPGSEEIRDPETGGLNGKNHGKTHGKMGKPGENPWENLRNSRTYWNIWGFQWRFQWEISLRKWMRKSLRKSFF